MISAILLPGFTIQNIEEQDHVLVIQAQSVSSFGTCPVCQTKSSRIHSYHNRSPADLPVSDRRIRLILVVKRFYCMNKGCSKCTFVEQAPEFVPRYAHRTCRLTKALQEIAFTCGGEPGARLAEFLHMTTSPDTLLRIIRQVSFSSIPIPNVLGVDDFAFRRGQRYGTILVDLEKHYPVDLLPNRSAETLAGWLENHPGIQWITRDRSTEYARGIMESGTKAMQIVDRWHLLRNLRDAIERILTRLYSQLKELPLTSSMQILEVPILPKRKKTPVELARQEAKRAERIVRYQDVQKLYAEGMSIREIAQRMGMHRVSAQLFAHSPVYPERAPHQSKASILSPYLPYLQQRFQAGCTNSQQLWREIQDKGFKGTSKQVIRWVQQAKAGGPTRTVTLPAPKQLVWVLLKEPSRLTDTQPTFLEYILQNPSIQKAYSLTQEFREMVKTRNAEPLDEWLATSQESEIAEFRNLASGLRQDYLAIRAALTEVWSNGQVEGQNNRLKLLKRQMYGRAKLDLLHQRVLYRHP